MDDGTGLAEVLLGLDGFRVLDVVEGPDELVVTIEPAAEVVGCAWCGVRAEAQDRMRIVIRALSCFERPPPLAAAKLINPLAPARGVVAGGAGGYGVVQARRRPRAPGSSGRDGGGLGRRGGGLGRRGPGFDRLGDGEANALKGATMPMLW